MFQNITTDKPLITSGLQLFHSHSSQQEDDSHSEKAVEEDEDTSKTPVRTTLDSLRICLFCNKECSGVKKCLDHMRLKHSFYVLDVDCVISLKGLLTYIAERIQLGQLCLFCSKMFRNPRRCQQHMMDKSHCFMNVGDEHEYEQYYDFSRTYGDHSTAEEDNTEGGAEAKPEKKVKEPKEGGDEWEDVDVEDGDEDEESSDEEGKKTETPSKSESAFSVVTDDDKNPSSSKFTLVEGGASSSSKTFQNVEKDSGVIIEDSLSSIKSGGADTFGGKAPTKKGLTREEARLGLKVKPAELLETGEILLPNGKIIGSRSLRYIYKQRFRPSDLRENVVVNKLALEYRKIQAITNGVIEEKGALASRITQDQIRTQVSMWKKQTAKDIKYSMSHGKAIPRPTMGC